jgi:hypothetical protein
VDKRNIAYWDELCGTNLAKAIGVTDNTATSLQRFDDWFFEFYPYLCEHVQLDELSGLDVLEIGLGYGHQRVSTIAPRRWFAYRNGVLRLFLSPVGTGKDANPEISLRGALGLSGWSRILIGG